MLFRQKLGIIPQNFWGETDQKSLKLPPFGSWYSICTCVLCFKKFTSQTTKKESQDFWMLRGNCHTRKFRSESILDGAPFSIKQTTVFQLNSEKETTSYIVLEILVGLINAGILIIANYNSHIAGE